MRVEVKDGKNKTYFYRYDLKNQFNLTFKKTGKYTGIWLGNIDDGLCLNLKQFCKKNHLYLNMTEEQYMRNHDYKKSFFEKNKGLLKNGIYYHCAYCGRIMKKDIVTVDHVIPIQKVKSSQNKKFYQLLMGKCNMKNINDVKNLVAACQYCNSKKGSKAGLWIFRGFIGRYFITWIIIYLAIFLWVLCLIHLHG